MSEIQLKDPLANEVTICPLLRRAQVYRAHTAPSLTRKRNGRKSSYASCAGMLTQTIWQTLNMPIRGETNYSSMSFMIPPLSLSVSHSLWVQKSSQHCHGAGGLGGFSKPFDSTTLHKAKLSFETPTLHCIFIAFPLLFLLGTYFAPEMAPIRSL